MGIPSAVGDGSDDDLSMSSEPAREPEDDPAQEAVAARIDDDAWSILCGVEACGGILAACSWLDVQFLMILNSPNDAEAQRAMARLPRPQYRTYRLCAEFPLGWKKSPEGIWRESRLMLRTTQRSSSGNPTAIRVVRGQLTSASPQLEAEPPAYAECPRCAALNLIERHRRVGIPGYAGEPERGRS